MPRGRKGKKKDGRNQESNPMDLKEKESVLSTMKGFPTADVCDEEYETNRKLIQQQNRKKKKSGGFQSMGLSHSVFTGITRKGYKVPTPIQRKTIPLILDGKDVVAMARTGSGKTAAFLIPLFEKLKVHSAQSGARALIMSPTRELALQTLKFTKELGRFTGLRAAVILGGDKMEDQFAALHENPDIIIATPGRFLHVIVEMDLKLTSVEYVVFDEADRLFEMGFQEQMHESLKRLSDSRQTVLFSATLPKLLVDFARAGLHDPILIRLDVDSKLSEHLQTSYFYCRLDDKCSLLLHLLRNVVKDGHQTVVFVATKHHVEYLNQLLGQAGIPCSYIYSSLDQTARKINIGKFQHKKTNVLLVTDLAARGIDIPMLDNVINFHFPAKGKLFVHRVGRVARAGRTGTAYSFVSPDETALLLDLHLFLGRPLKMACAEKDDGLFGCVPQSLLDDVHEEIRVWHKTSSDLQNMKKVCANGYKAYLRSRPLPSKESVKRSKELDIAKLAIHPVFGTEENELQRIQILDSMKNYRPSSTIFEINSTMKNSAFGVMKTKRDKHEQTIEARMRQRQEQTSATKESRQQESDELDMENIESAFSKVVAPKRKLDTGDNFQPRQKKRKRKNIQIRDEENFLQYRPSDYQTEKGLGLQTSFEREAAGAVLDLTGDDEKQSQKMKNTMKWDRKKKKYVSMNKDMEQKKKIRTESGVWISASYKSNAYKDWMNKTKQMSQDSDDSGDEGTKKGRRGKVTILGHRGRQKHLPDQSKFAGNKRKFKTELKSKDNIVKDRIKREQVFKSQKRRQILRQKRKGGASGGKKRH